MLCLGLTGTELSILQFSARVINVGVFLFSKCLGREKKLREKNTDNLHFPEQTKSMHKISVYFKNPYNLEANSTPFVS